MDGSKDILIAGASFAGLATAFWMRRAGFNVTVIEIAEGLKQGGTPVNIRNRTVGIVKHMGLFDQIHSNRLNMQEPELIGTDDVTERPSWSGIDEGHSEDGEFEIERDVLLRLMFDAVKQDVKFIFGDSIASLREANYGIDVIFRKGAKRSFHLVFGCDGVRSDVRKLWFGAEEQFSHFLGAYGSVTIVDKLLIPENTAQMYNEPGKLALLSAYNNKTDIILVFSSESEIPYDHRSNAQKINILMSGFSGVGWRTQELLKEVTQSKSFYFDKLSQIKMPSWTKGRVALVGDAAYCASPAAGMGGSLAIDGAAALADAFREWGGNFELAFQEYDDSFRPFIEECQANAVRFGLEFLVPKTAEAIRARNSQLQGNQHVEPSISPYRRWASLRNLYAQLVYARLAMTKSMSATGFAAAGALAHGRPALASAALACMGIVFGDIGTSPLYTLQVAVKTASPGGVVAPAAVVGLVSLIFWSLIIVISIKYAILIMRASNHGEGGILALLAMVTTKSAPGTRRATVMLIIGLVGATLLYGDGAITPAISVLSAVEGIKLYAPQMGRCVVPLTLVILVALFLIQRKGTAWIGRLFGPIMLLWFFVIGLLGIVGIARGPAILAAFSPLPAIAYLTHAGPLALAVIGGAFLAVTGGEAFYADMGHFGPRPIRFAWFTVALPALTLNYFGQGGLLLTQPAAIENSFYLLAPEWAHYFLVGLATVATVIASQSIISGAYSLTSQAIQLGFLPRMHILHTAGHEMGQIYVPVVNWLLAFGTLAAVIGFGSSDALAGAFGIAVSLLMAITTLMATFVALQWKHSPILVLSVNGSLLALDLLFVASTSAKLLDGGWFPLAISFVIAFLMLTWRKGQAILDSVRLEIREHSEEFIDRIHSDPPYRIPGTAVVLGRMKKGVPLPLTRNVNFNRVLHERVLLVAIEMTDTPRVDDEQRVTVTALSQHILRVQLQFGFMETPDVPKGLQTAVAHHLIAACNLQHVTYFAGHETIIPAMRYTGMARWRKTLFALMHRNAQQSAAYFNIPSPQVMEIGVEFVI